MRYSIRACHAQVIRHAVRNSTRACCRAQQYPGMPHASIRACCTQRSIRACCTATTYPGPCPAPAGCVPITTEYPSMPRATVSEHAAHASIRACCAQQYPSMPRIKMAALHPAEFWGPGLSLREASVGEEALPMDKAGGVLRRSLLWKPVAKRSGPQRLAVVFLERWAWATTTLYLCRIVRSSCMWGGRAGPPHWALGVWG